MIVILFPMSWISSAASTFHDPPVSIATGMKMWILVILCILSSSRRRHVCGIVCCCSSLKRGSIKVELCVCIWDSYNPSHEPAVSTLHHLDVWRLRVTDTLTSLKLVPEPPPYYVIEHCVADGSRSTLLACKILQTTSVDLGAIHACMGVTRVGSQTMSHRHSDGFIRQSET